MLQSHLSGLLLRELRKKYVIENEHQQIYIHKHTYYARVTKPMSAKVSFGKLRITFPSRFLNSGKKPNSQ